SATEIGGRDAAVAFPDRGEPVPQSRTRQLSPIARHLPRHQRPDCRRRRAGFARPWHCRRSDSHEKADRRASRQAAACADDAEVRRTGLSRNRRRPRMLRRERAGQRLSSPQTPQGGVVKAMSNANEFERLLMAGGTGEALVEKLVRDAHAALRPKLEIVRRPEAALGAIATPLGPLLVAIGPRGLAMVHYMDHGGTERALQALRYRFDPVEDSRAVRGVGREISDFIAGDLDALKSRIDLSLVESPFRLAALRRLREVPAGSVVTYQALAA